MRLAVVCNAAAGHGGARRVLEECVRPRLRGAEPVAYYETDAETGARRAGEALARDPPPGVVVLGGDGTLHELLEGVLGDGSRLDRPMTVVLVPTGTANAMYASLYRPALPAGTDDDDAWRLAALDALDTAPAQPLTLMRVHTPAAHLACVVASHALHAAILRDSEALRATHPGLERFQIAAQQNAGTWSEARLVLHGGTRGVQLYSPHTDAFEDVGEAYARTDGAVIVEGPFAYMNAMTVERLEPAFVPAPFASGHAQPSLRRPHDALDVVVVRPARSPRFSADADAAQRRAFGEGPLSRVLFEGMYREGAHVAFVYAPDGAVRPSGPAARG
ncbi:hypothetical protein MOBT1_003020 [Malassezia obtusa]|uniref:DAGKc domain-containing protein n=1 Tax=Malassezia obtusa TaxID=76774 RepID=A0AAF0E116_9BASI|nr:hypothetical protein MOBT1_003020 [Malassezia obtusa]